MESETRNRRPHCIVSLATGPSMVRERSWFLSLSLSAEVPLLNRSRLHLVSHTLVNISDCTGRLLIGCLELCDRTVRISKKNCHFEPLGT